ncbi:lysophospholipid acyltransferase family protein [Alkalimarinus coralli]|uniref:lysophospholipid acyltransferase family protein n=1 Tax=Alkalimarinus coralli TaxID=2935863 RepID=UPI00202B4882|nr:lysophospholipid acyltransferase family protein [Alkalimarinus coralli]
MDSQIEEILAFKPSDKGFADKVLRPSELYFSPKSIGTDNIPKDRPVLFVGNHTIYGVFDPMLIVKSIYQHSGVFPRSLADHMHFGVPLWTRYIKSMGIVEGTREICSALMQDRQSVLVFPGGAREVFKRKGESYKLVWKARVGFVKMAIQHGYDIVPFASVGPDDALSVLLDANDIAKGLGQRFRGSRFYKKTLRNGDMIPPVTRGIGLTAIPRPERFYFSFGKPIATSELQGKEQTDKLLFETRDVVAEAINSQIDELLKLREQDSDKGWLRKLLTAL